MNIYRKCALGRKRNRLAYFQPDLFAWADEEASLLAIHESRAARMIARRFALSPSHARLIAEQAGFAVEVYHG
jgi:hypothetical protein